MVQLPQRRRPRDDDVADVAFGACPLAPRRPPPRTDSTAPLRVTELRSDNARGQRARITDGEGATSSTTTTTTYDPQRLWLTRLRTVRAADGAILQDLQYSRDHVGNVIEIDDEAQPTRWFDNAQVSPARTNADDPLYRLSSATGRERVGLGQADVLPFPVELLPHGGAANTVLRRTTQSDVDDAAGNLCPVGVDLPVDHVKYVNKSALTTSCGVGSAVSHAVPGAAIPVIGPNGANGSGGEEHSPTPCVDRGQLSQGGKYPNSPDSNPSTKAPDTLGHSGGTPWGEPNHNDRPVVGKRRLTVDEWEATYAALEDLGPGLSWSQGISHKGAAESLAYHFAMHRESFGTPTVDSELRKPLGVSRQRKAGKRKEGPSPDIGHTEKWQVGRNIPRVDSDGNVIQFHKNDGNYD